MYQEIYYFHLYQKSILQVFLEYFQMLSATVVISALKVKHCENISMGGWGEDGRGQGSLGVFYTQV